MSRASAAPLRARPVPARSRNNVRADSHRAAIYTRFAAQAARPALCGFPNSSSSYANAMDGMGCGGFTARVDRGIRQRVLHRQHVGDRRRWGLASSDCPRRGSGHSRSNQVNCVTSCSATWGSSRSPAALLHRRTRHRYPARFACSVVQQQTPRHVRCNRCADAGLPGLLLRLPPAAAHAALASLPSLAPCSHGSRPTPPVSPIVERVQKTLGLGRGLRAFAGAHLPLAADQSAGLDRLHVRQHVGQHHRSRQRRAHCRRTARRAGFAWWANPSIFHALHHARWQGHFGFQSAGMDRLFGSEFADWPVLHAQISARRALTSLRAGAEHKG